MGKRKYSLEQFKLAVEQSYSVAGALKKLGLAPKGGNYGVFHRYKELYNVDTSHFTGQGHLKGKTHNYTTKPLEEILVEGNYYQSHALRLRLIREGIKEHKCECCGLSEWMGQPISLELDHIDGNNKNNKLENLRVLCPNCHAQTLTYRGRNKKRNNSQTQKNKTQRTRIKKKYYCSSCGIQLSGKYKTGLCLSCYKKNLRKVERPSIEILLKEINESSYCAVARKYGVSDNCIRKWIKNHKK